MSIAHSVGASARPRRVVADKPKPQSLLTSPGIVVILVAQVFVTGWFFRESLQSPTELARAVLMGCIPLCAVWSAMSLLRSMCTRRD